MVNDLIDIHFPDTVWNSIGGQIFQSRLENVILGKGRVEPNTVSGRDGTTFNVYTDVPDDLRLPIIKFLNGYGLDYSFTIYKG